MVRYSLGMISALILVCACNVQAQDANAKVIRAGMIGLDTSHVPAFARLLNKANANSELAGIQVVAGYPGGTDIPASRDRVGKFTTNCGR